MLLETSGWHVLCQPTSAAIDVDKLPMINVAKIPQILGPFYTSSARET